MELRILLYMPYIYYIFCQCFCLSPSRCLSLIVLSPSLLCLYNVTMLQLVNMTLFKVLQGGWQCTEEINLAAYQSTCSSICFYPMTRRQLCRQRTERYWVSFINQLLCKKYRKKNIGISSMHEVKEFIFYKCFSIVWYANWHESQTSRCCETLFTTF